MRCASCGTEGVEGARYCHSCGRRLPEQPEPQFGASPPGHQQSDLRSTPPPFGAERPVHHVPTNLVWAILATLFCCLPAGIVSIVYAAQVNGKLTAGDLEGALRASNSAKTWALISVALGLVAGAIFLATDPLGGPRAV